MTHEVMVGEDIGSGLAKVLEQTEKVLVAEEEIILM